MAATMATMATLNANCLSTNTHKVINTLKPKPASLLSMQNLPKGLLTPSRKTEDSILSNPLTGTALAGAIFSTLSSCDAAFAAQQTAEGDNRGLALLLPIVPAIAWVLYNILQPALNQLNQMRSSKGIIIGLGLGGLAASGFIHTPQASAASEIAAIAEATEATGDNRGQLLLFVIAPAIIWVLYNILQPALNQIDRMRSS